MTASPTLVDLATCARERAEAVRDLDRKTAALRDAVVRANAERGPDGHPIVTEIGLAQLAGVTRMTIRSWLGK